MKISEKTKIVLPILLIAAFVFSAFGWIYWFQNYQMKRTLEAERLLDQISKGMHEINRTVQSGILTIDERYAVQAARHSLRVFEILTALEKLHPEKAGTIRRMYLDYYVKSVSINSLFLENRLEEGRTRLAELEISHSRISAEMNRLLALQIDQYRHAVKNINVFMAATSAVFSAVLILISGLFMHYSRKRREAEKALVEAEKMASLGTLSAGLAHEIRNPLAIILLGVEDMASSLSADPGQRDVINGIKQAVLRAEDIIRGLLSFCEGLVSEHEKVDVLSVLEESLLVLKQQRELRNIRIKKEFPPDMPKVRCNGDQLRQAFLNILANAIESIPGSGTVRVICRKAAPNSLAITFADTGVGIPEAEIGKVMDPFYTTKQKTGNVGLGLSISRGIIEGHGGTLKIESALGKGTRVTVFLQVSG